MHDGQSSKPSLPKWLPLAGLIVLALVMRLPRIGEIVSTHDWLTSHTALVTRVWQMTGLAANHYSLVTNWPNPPDLKIQHGTASVLDDRGNTYFLSFPPFAFYLSFLFFQVLGQGASIFPLRLLMMLLSSLGAWAFASAIRTAWGAGGDSRAPSLIAAAVFLLSPASLLYFGAAYFPLILSIPLWMGLLAEAVRPVPRPWLIALAGFTICYTDWLGFLAAIPLTVIWLRRRQWRLIAALPVPAAVALAITLVTYSGIAGWPALLESIQTKYLMRAGLANDSSTFSIRDSLTYSLIFRNYYLGFLPLVVPFVWSGICFALGRGRPGVKLPSSVWTLFWCLAIPVALDNLLLLNHTAGNRFAVLKAAPLLGCALAMCLTARAWSNRRLDVACGVLTVALCFYTFMRVRFDADQAAPEIARIVQYQVGLEQMLFLQRNPTIGMAEPALLLLSERNFHMVDSIADAQAKLRKLGLAKGYYFAVVTYNPVTVAGLPISTD